MFAGHFKFAVFPPKHYITLYALFIGCCVETLIQARVITSIVIL